MAIAIPSVSKYLAQSRTKTYMNTLSSYADGVTKMVANDELPGMYAEDTVYYIPFNCIPTEKSVGSPNGDWDFAYVLLTTNNGINNYYLYTKDVKGIGVEGIKVDSIKTNDIKQIDSTKTDYIGVEGKSNIKIVDETCNYQNMQTAVVEPV